MKFKIFLPGQGCNHYDMDKSAYIRRIYNENQGSLF